MKRCAKIGMIVLGAAALLAFASCKEKQAANGNVTLTVWESTNGPDEFIKQAGKAFEATHPNVKIKFENVELGDTTGQMALDGPAGKGADVFVAPHDRLGSLVSGGHVLPTANPDKVRSRILASCAKALTYDGTLYGYPVSAETYALFYNKKLINENEVPKSWDELVEWSAEFNKKNPGKYGFVMDAGNAYYTIIFTTKDGNRLFGTDGNDRNNSNINSAKSIEGMRFFQGLKKVLNVSASDLDTATVDAAFQSGNAAMHITGLWNVVPFEKAGIEFGVAPLPSLPGDTTPSASFSGTRAMFVSAYSDHPAEANEFAEFLISDEMQRLRFDITGAIPSIDIPLDSPYAKGFLTQLEYAFPMPTIPEMAMFWEAMNNASKNIWDGADPQTELDACNAAMVSK
ncbi:MAG: maltose ABC transporter substrate-binding protein [Treponema sp.]|uniref:sugar ABC transporter substrate-binding protein n=1 Tax=Treponema sp. TaxID=166 RepID=UPI0025F74C33|nr:maltose ABC transporter substrate-binding protein [Treponema sp.]MBQ9280957.1 maltose ABC transporter substrate-binding protein [Treponema sp.]